MTRRDGAQRAWKPVPPQVALSVPLLLVAVCISACDSKPTTPPPAGNPVIWTRLTDPANVNEPDHPDWRGDSVAFDYLDPSGNGRLGVMGDDGIGALLYPDAIPSKDVVPAWVDDDLLAYSSNRANIPVENYDLWYMDRLTGTERRLTAFAESEWDPAPRPGLPSLVYTEGVDPLRGRITLIPDTAAATPTRLYLTPGSLEAGEASWDSAGNRLCFSVEDPDGSRHVWIITLTGTTVDSSVQITTGPAHDRDPRFSPDGARILFTSDRGGLSGVWWVTPAGDANGIDAIAYDDLGAEIRAASWSPDGQSIVLSSDRQGGRALWILSNLGL